MTAGPRPSAGLSRSLDLPQRQVQAALDELHGLGAALPQSSRTGDERIWSGRPPDEVVPAIRRHQRELTEAHTQLQRRMEQWTAIDWATGGLRSASPIYGLSRVRARIDELVAAERNEHLAMNPEPLFNTDSVRASIPLDISLALRAITCKTIGVPPAQGRRRASSVRGPKDEYREAGALPTKLLVMDRTTALLPLDPLDHGKGAWEINAPEAIERLVRFFLARWEQSRPPAPRRLPPAPLNHRQQAIVALLAAGDTDAVMATKLRISVRTIAYTISQLMDQNDVQNRFQLGLILGQRCYGAGGQPVALAGPADGIAKVCWG